MKLSLFRKIKNKTISEFELENLTQDDLQKLYYFSVKLFK